MFQTTKSKKPTLLYLPVSSITPSPFSVRTLFDGFELSLLADSIKKNGLIEPITVRKTDGGKYEILSGERRLRASVLNGVKNIKALCIEADDRAASLISLAENIHRKDLHFFEISAGIKNVLDNTDITREELSARLNLSQSAISNKLRLLNLEDCEKRKIIKNNLSERHSRALLRLSSDKRRELLDIIISKNLTVSETERLVETILNPPVRPKRKVLTGDIKLFQNSITRLVSSLCRSGGNAVQSKSETEEYVEYTVRIPKQKTVIPFSRLS